MSFKVLSLCSYKLMVNLTLSGYYVTACDIKGNLQVQTFGYQMILYIFEDWKSFYINST